MQQNTSVYSGFCPVHASYTANTAKQRTGLYRRFSCGLSHFTAADARPAQAAIYHLRHARAYHSAVAPPTRARYHSRAGTLDRPAQTAYYNKVYKSAETHLLWIHARQCSISQTMQARRRFDASRARRLSIWHRSAVRAHRVSLAPSTRRGSPVAGARRAARNHWRLSPHLFSGFRPIANRDQQ